MSENISKKNFSVRTKMLLLLLIALSAFAVIASAISYNIYLDSSIEKHKQLALGVANLVADSIDPDKVDEYLEKGYDAAGYNATKMRLYKVRDSSPDIKYVYVYKILEDGCHVVFDLDTPEMSGQDPGFVEEFSDTFEPFLPTLLSGGEIDPIISDDSYGWLLTIYVPVKNFSGVTQCYAAVDVSMDELRTQSRDYLKKLAGIFSIILIMILLGGFHFVNRNILSPINKIAHSAEDFAFKNEETFEKNLEQIRNLDIRTGDEIENLYLAFVKMTEDTVKYIDDVEKKNKTISQMQDALIITLADLVESRDENTGQHIKKTAEYVRIILKEMKRKGVYSDQLTDKFITDVYRSAPLHDIGKIAVPDSILNKPGKLTKEEFDIMKTHTTAGGRILSSIIEMVPDSHYLYEAKNLATYHHERWDGKGYPTGLSEENIPLSARIMAVADVFDALVSKRSYKEGFPLDKAMNIILEERGTHFDPKLVDIFLAAREEVFEVAKKFSDTTNTTISSE